MFGVEIHFKDGRLDWVDPCEDDPEILQGMLSVSNLNHTYHYLLSEIDGWEKYPLCKVCEFDVRTYGCSEERCEF